MMIAVMMMVMMMWLAGSVAFDEPMKSDGNCRSCSAVPSRGAVRKEITALSGWRKIMVFYWAGSLRVSGLQS